MVITEIKISNITLKKMSFQNYVETLEKQYNFKDTFPISTSNNFIYMNVRFWTQFYSTKKLIIYIIYRYKGKKNNSTIINQAIIVFFFWLPFEG